MNTLYELKIWSITWPHAFVLTEVHIDCLKQNGYFLETQVGINVVGKVLSVLSDAGLNSDRVVIQSEDSAVLKRISQTDNYTLAYRVVETNVTINTDVVTEIKALATYATLPRGLIQQTYQDYLLNNSHVVDEFHAQNVSVFVSYLRNIFITWMAWKCRRRWQEGNLTQVVSFLF